jgi:hypothetical protein
MFTFEIDPTKNVIKFIIAHEVREEEVLQCVDDLKKSIGRLKSGFQILTDITYLKKADSTGPIIKYVDRIMDLCNEHGASQVVRVIPDASRDIGFNIMSLFHYGKEVKILTCETMKEAIQRIDHYNTAHPQLS